VTRCNGLSSHFVLLRTSAPVTHTFPLQYNCMFLYAIRQTRANIIYAATCIYIFKSATTLCLMGVSGEEQH
jgi:hypothetical protein